MFFLSHIKILYLPRIFNLRFFLFLLLQIIFHFGLQSTIVAYAEGLSQIDEDPYLDPQASNVLLNPSKRADSARSFMFGISYGLNPIVILAPAVSLSMYWDPLVIGVEISDSDQLGIWEKERQTNFGRSQFSGETQFLKWFLGENIYLLAAREHREVKLWSRTFNRTSGQATFDMFVETTVASLGVGLLRFNDIGFLAIDILRYNIVQNHSVEIVEYWETWTELDGSREKLDENYNTRSEKWEKNINSPTGFVVTFGIYF